jgi:hypothetical protein
MSRLAKQHVMVCGLLALFLILLSLTGCGTGRPDVNAPPQSGGSPLDAYRYTAWGSETDQAELDLRLGRDFEEAVSACMNDAGFDYDHGGSSDEDQAPVAMLDPSSQEYRKQYGYGVTDTGERFPSDTERNVGAQAANEDYRSTLSSVGEQEYDLALQGEQMEVEENFFANVGGCYNAAWDQVYLPAIDQGEWDDLIADIDAVYDTAMASKDAEVVRDDWGSCMEEQGRPALDSPEAAVEHIQALLDGLFRPNEEGLVVADPLGLAELRELEVEMALADLKCQEEINYRARLNEVLWEYEGEFVKDRKVDLEAWALFEQEKATD